MSDDNVSMQESKRQLAELGDALAAMSHEERMESLLGLRKPVNRAEFRLAGRTNKDRQVLLADIVDWQSGEAKGTTTEGMKPSVRAIKRVSGGRRRD